MDWYYTDGSNRAGPVKPVAFESLVRDNIIKGGTLVWSEGMGDWQPFQQIEADTAVCAASGGRYWRRDMVPYEGKFVSAEHKEEFFQRLREGVGQPGQMVYANFGTRLVAKLLDGIINWVIGTVSNLGLSLLLLGGMFFNPTPNDGIDPGRFLVFQIVSFFLNLGLGLVYYWYFLKHRDGATLGKMALGIKVVRSDGSPLSTGRIIGRFFAEWLSSLILMIGYLMAGFDEERRTLHDRICDTRVIKSR